jgi:hypothetical protein
MAIPISMKIKVSVPWGEKGRTLYRPALNAVRYSSI